MSYSLIVVDMQSGFQAAKDPKVQEACAREIRRAIQHNAWIFFVEFVGWGDTFHNLTDIAYQAQYSKVQFVVKNEMDGSEGVIDFLRDRHLPRRNYRVVGVNTDQCVFSTVKGLRLTLSHSEIHVVEDACNSESLEDHRYGLKRISALSNTTILQTPEIG